MHSVLVPDIVRSDTNSHQCLISYPCLCTEDFHTIDWPVSSLLTQTEALPTWTEPKRLFKPLQDKFTLLNNSSLQFDGAMFCEFIVKNKKKQYLGEMLSYICGTAGKALGEASQTSDVQCQQNGPNILWLINMERADVSDMTSLKCNTTTNRFESHPLRDSLHPPSRLYRTATHNGRVEFSIKVRPPAPLYEFVR